MLQITIPEAEFFNEQTEEFINIKKQTLQLEHSLISISKWEAKWCKPFLGEEEKTGEELIDYIRCMTITQGIDPNAYLAIPRNEMERIKEYIHAPMTATWFKDTDKRPSRKVITSELIYYWMISQNVPLECEKWHLNRLFTLLRVCSEKNAPPKKMSKKQAAAQQRSLNAKRHAARGRH